MTGREIPPTGTKLGEFRVVQAVWEEQKEQEQVQWLFTTLNMTFRWPEGCYLGCFYLPKGKATLTLE